MGFKPEVIELLGVATKAGAAHFSAVVQVFEVCSCESDRHLAPRRSTGRVDGIEHRGFVAELDTTRKGKYPLDPDLHVDSAGGVRRRLAEDSPLVIVVACNLWETHAQPKQGVETVLRVVSPLQCDQSCRRRTWLVENCQHQSRPVPPRGHCPCLDRRSSQVAVRLRSEAWMSNRPAASVACACTAAAGTANAQII